MVHTMLVIMLVILQMVTREQQATFVHASKDYASELAWSMRAG